MYTMTTVRLTPTQKQRLEEGKLLLEGLTGERLTHGEVVRRLADAVLDHREVLAADPEQLTVDARRDPMLDWSITFDMGRTDARSHDRVLYGKR